jgi:hypothetical protein
MTGSGSAIWEKRKGVDNGFTEKEGPSGFAERKRCVETKTGIHLSN